MVDYYNSSGLNSFISSVGTLQDRLGAAERHRWQVRLSYDKVAGGGCHVTRWQVAAVMWQAVSRQKFAVYAGAAVNA